MVTGKTFFSYSRDDSEFVLKLAKDLRAAGADVWLDQLDIGAGKRWDAEIETALESSQGQLVILSPSSVSSNNVMDEVSYALEKGKQVIPILFKECQIPFRLKRLQYLDFTGNYETGFNQLLKSLNLEKKKESEKAQSIPGAVDVIKSNEEKAAIEKQKLDREAERKRKEQLAQDKILKERKLEEERKKHSTAGIPSKQISTFNKGPLKWVIGASLLIVVIIVAVLVFNSSDEEPFQDELPATNINNGDPSVIDEGTTINEDEMWSDAVSRDTKDAYEEYLSLFPQGKHVEHAQECINNFNLEEMAKEDESAWSIANSTDNILAYKQYMTNYPEGKYSSEAATRMEELQDILENYASLVNPEDLVTCTNIQNMDPVGVKNNFSAGKVYAWATLRAPKKETVTFEWLDDSGNIIYERSIKVGMDENGYRIYDPQTFNTAGTYEVVLYNSKGIEIGSQEFIIE